MDSLSDLIGRELSCACGALHHCPVKHVIIENGALKRIEELCGGYRRLLLVMDANTEAVCGASVRNRFKAAKIGFDEIVFQDKLLVPNEKALGRIEERVHRDTDLIIGIGSGVINDLCKYVSHQKELPYFIIATAPSMDGYASPVAALILNHLKITRQAHVPDAIIADIDILRSAPFEMIQAGYGDVIGKFSSLNDWKLSHLVTGESFCPFIHDLVMDAAAKAHSMADGLIRRSEQAVKALMEALIATGVAMCYAGNSRPASGSEHHLSHFFEVTGLLYGRTCLLHGLDVAYSSVKTAELRQELVRNGYRHKPFDINAWENKMRSVYGSAAEGVIGLQKKLGWLGTDRSKALNPIWLEITDILKSSPSSDDMREYLAKAGLNYRDFEKTYGSAVIDDAVHCAKYLKDRFTVLWLCED